MPTLSESELVTLRHRQPAQVEWFLAVAPFGDPLCTARVNDAGIARGAMGIVFDGAAGDCNAVEPGMTLWIGSTGSSNDLGSVRIRWCSGSHFGVAENSEILWADDLFLTVPGEGGFREPWSVFPRMVEAGGAVTFYKDYNIPYTNQGDHLPPKANAGPPAIAFIDSITGLASLDWIGQTSYATEAAGDPLVSWAWQFPDGTPPTSALEGTVAAPIPVTWDTPGFRYVKLVVADSLGTTGTTHVPVWIFDESSPTVPWTKVEVTSQDGSVSAGWKARLKVWNAGPADFPERSLVVLGVRTWYRGTRQEIGGWPNRENIRFVGWVDKETLTYDAIAGVVEFEAVGLSAVMERLPAFTVYLEEDGSPSEWHEMVDNNADRISHHVLEFNTTINQIAGVVCPREGNTRKIEARGFPDASLFAQLQDNLWEDTKSRMTSNRQGILHITRDPQMMVAVDRATVDVVCTLTNQDWMDTIDVPTPHIPELGFVELGGFGYGTPYLSQAPGAAPLQQERDNRVDGCILDTADPQANANWWSGLVLTKANVTYPDLPITLKGFWPVFEPALQEYVRLNFEDPDGRRPFDGERFIVRGVSFRDEPVMGTAITSLELESENVLLQGETVDIPIPPPPEPPEPPPPPIPPPSEMWEGPIKACVAWTKSQLGYTNDLLLHHVSSETTAGTAGIHLYDTAVDFHDLNIAVGDTVENMGDHAVTTVASIVSGNHITLNQDIGLGAVEDYHLCGAQWVDIKGAFSGEIIQFLYVQTGPSTLGGWVLTKTAVYWTSNILSSSPSWTLKLTLAQVAAMTGTTLINFGGMHAYVSNPGFLIVSFQVWSGVVGNIRGCVYTTDTGGSWNLSTFPAGMAKECPMFGIEIDETSGMIFHIRGCPVPDRGCIFRGTVPGAAFVRSGRVANGVHVDTRADLYRPYGGGNLFVHIRAGYNNPGISADDGANWTALTAAGYSPKAWGGISGWYGDPNNIFGLWINTTGSHEVLLRSLDMGSSWTEIGNAEVLFPPIVQNVSVVAESWIPNKDVLVWVGNRTTGWAAVEDGDCRIRYTDDNGLHWCDKQGTWRTNLDFDSDADGHPDWAGGGSTAASGGNCGCIPLPRIGSNE